MAFRVLDGIDRNNLKMLLSELYKSYVTICQSNHNRHSLLSSSYVVDIQHLTKNNASCHLCFIAEKNGVERSLFINHGQDKSVNLTNPMHVFTNLSVGCYRFHLSWTSISILSRRIWSTCSIK